MVAGDTTYLRGGTFVETAEVRFVRSGTSVAPITLKAYPNETPVVSFSDPTNGNHRVSIWHSSGEDTAIGWIVIEGITFTNTAVGVRFYSAHDVIIRGNTFRANTYHGMLGNGTRILIDRNIVTHNGRFTECLAGLISCNKEHGIYMNGSDITIINNLIYDNLGYGIQMNGSSSAIYNPAVHPGPEFANSFRWIIANNTIAYNRFRSAIAAWGSLCDDARIENNIFYENSVSSSSANGIDWVSATGSTNVRVRNNHVFASSPGGTAFQSAGAPADLVSTGNVVNVSAPAFVAGGSGTLPASPDFRLTARAPVNIALANEFPTNGVVGVFQPLNTPIGSITANKVRLTFSAATRVPVGNLSATGSSVACTGTNCPGALTTTSVSNVPGADTQVEMTVQGFVGDACPSLNMNATASYNSATGTWTGNDNIGAHPTLNQKVLSFTNIPLTNNCTDTGPTGYPVGYHLYYKFDEGTGTNVNDESANNLDCTFTNGPTWGPGKTGTGMVTAGNNTQHCAVPLGNAFNMATTSLTFALGINIPPGNEALSRHYVGPPLGAGQRLYVSTLASTWRLGLQGSNDALAGNIAVTSGQHHICVTSNHTTNLVTLFIDGVASTASGAVKSFTPPFSLAGDFDIGRIADQATGGGGGTYDEFILYQSVQSCPAIYAAFSAAANPAVGTLTQEFARFQGVILDTNNAPIPIGISSKTIYVPNEGGAVVLFQVRCSAGTPCDETAFKLVSAKNGSSTWQQVPNINSFGTWMWGVTTEAHLNMGLRSTTLSGSCTMVSGATQLTAEQVPSITLPADNCTVLAYVVRVNGTPGTDYFDYKLQTAAGLDLNSYSEVARINVINYFGGGIGF